MSCPIEFGDDGVNAIAQIKQLPTSALLVGDDPINAGPQLLLAHPADGRCLLAHSAKVAVIALDLKAKISLRRNSPNSLAMLTAMRAPQPQKRIPSSLLTWR